MGRPILPWFGAGVFGVGIFPTDRHQAIAIGEKVLKATWYHQPVLCFSYYPLKTQPKINGCQHKVSNP